jgi:hypothetical protein
MRQRGMFIAIGLLLFVNAAVLAGVAYNRSGEPDAGVVLTERELPMAYGFRHQENSGVALRINTNHPFYWGRRSVNDIAFPWLDRKKLETLGFDLSELDIKEKEHDYSSRELPRRTFAVLAYEGSAWEKWKNIMEQEVAEIEQDVAQRKKTDKDLEYARRSYEHELKAGSRLFIVDAGNDPAELRKQYGDRTHFLIIPAKVHISYYGSYDAAQRKWIGSQIHGYVELLITEVNVPHDLHTRFDKQKGTGSPVSAVPYAGENGPRYQVVLCSGKRYEPWIADILPIEQK